MTEIYIDYDELLVSSRHEEGDYAEWEEHYSFSVNNAYLSNPHTLENFKTIHDVNVGDTVYVLYIVYSDGNSFGAAYGKGEVLWIFTSKEFANKAKETFTKAVEIDEYDKPYVIEIENRDYDEDPEDNPFIPQNYVTIEVENGTQVDVYNPVNDYNATLDYKIKVIEKTVKE